MKRTVLLLLMLAATAAQARVKLVALPERARVVVSLTHPDATLVEEERILTLQKGVNKVDFSWAAVNIDPSSIQIRMLGHPDKVLVLNTSYPPNENALVWEVSSPGAQEERVRISYLLTGLNSDMLSSGNGALNGNTKFGDRQETCGMAPTPSACSTADFPRM